MRKLSMACLAAAACVLTAPAIACPLTNGVTPDTSCVREALDKTIESAGLQKVPPMSIDEMRLTILNRPPLQKAYSKNLHACLERDHDCDGPAPRIAMPIDDVEAMEGVSNVTYCGIATPKGPMSHLASGPVYCPSGLQCRKLDESKIGTVYNCEAPHHHTCKGRSVAISCPEGWECVNERDKQTCRKKG